MRQLVQLEKSDVDRLNKGDTLTINLPGGLQVGVVFEKDRTGQVNGKGKTAMTRRYKTGGKYRSACLGCSRTFASQSGAYYHFRRTHEE